MKKWVKTLCSGKFKQGKQSLKIKTKKGIIKHCCLGVLCEIYNKEHINKLKNQIKKPDNIDLCINNAQSIFIFDSSSILLPPKVRKWAGLNDNCGTIKKGKALSFKRKSKNVNVFSLASLNDKGASFRKIAKLIEYRYKDL